MDLARKHQNAARFSAGWPHSDYVGFPDFIKKKASHLGGETVVRSLRSIGKPAFIPIPDAVKALDREKVLTGARCGKK